MARNRLNTEETVLGLVGEQPEQKKAEASASEPDHPEVKTVKSDKQTIPEEPGKRGRKKKDEETKPYTIHLTAAHNKAITMRMALSDKPEDKDRSSIVRAALDAYLADTIKNL